jgi:hypothetical protein
MKKSNCTAVTIAALLSLSLVAACGTVEEDAADSGTDTEAPDSGTDGQTDTDLPTDTDLQTDAELPDADQDAQIQTDVEQPDATADGGADPDVLPDSCTEPSPRGCADDGCADGQACVLSDADGCAPSSCSCDTENDVWVCTEDCGPMYMCAPIDEVECPAVAPQTGDACGAASVAADCSWGTETCCGATYPSYGCDCLDGTWACFATDACFIQSCEGRECTTSDDCTGGGEPTVCEGGVCVAAEESACPSDPPIGGSCAGIAPGTECTWGSETCCGETYPSTQCTCFGSDWACLATDACFIRSCEGRDCNEDSDCIGGGEATFCSAGTCVSASRCFGLDSESSCNATSACHWQIAGCGDDALGALPTGCYPSVDCAIGGCPEGAECRPDTTVLPECARGTGAVCDACAVSINVCVPAVAP